jgi:hypothetical protein
MKFVFRWHMQLNAGPKCKPCTGIRENALHAEAIADAADRFVRDRLHRKRQQTLGTRDETT